MSNDWLKVGKGGPPSHQVVPVAPGGAPPPPPVLLPTEPAQPGSVHRLQAGVWKGPLRKNLLQLVQEEGLQALASLGDLRVRLQKRERQTAELRPSPLTVKAPFLFPLT